MVISFLPNTRMHLIQLVLQMIRNVKGRQNLLLFTIISKERFKRTTIMVKGQGKKWMVIDRLKIICETFLAGYHHLIFVCCFFVGGCWKIVLWWWCHMMMISIPIFIMLVLLLPPATWTAKSKRQNGNGWRKTTRRRRRDDCSSLLPLSPLNSKGVHTI